MAENCFGEPVTNETLEKMGLPQTRENRARVAMSVMYDDDRKGQATRYVQNLKQLYGNGASTLCLLYNATGNTITYRARKDWWNGSLYGPSNNNYPSSIYNGQWAAFLHVHDQGAATGSLGAVVYQGTNETGSPPDLLVAWSTPWSQVYSNTAYCQIGDTDFWAGRWDEIEQKLGSAGYSWNSTTQRHAIDVQTERGTSPTFTAVIRLITSSVE
ncbi:unnamed protein product [Urochloa decumbens]|uniref:23 kDa jasmonate-induced protein-like n=1 Tax=Urochloa decumbens TaxID=240449 RepID=A0ABC8VYI2_9POAL